MKIDQPHWPSPPGHSCPFGRAGVAQNSWWWLWIAGATSSSDRASVSTIISLSRKQRRGLIAVLRKAMKQFSRVVSFLVVLCTFAVVALASHTRRQSMANIESVLTTLQTSIAPIMLNIENQLSLNDLLPPLLALENSLNSATMSLAALDVSSTRRALAERQTENDIASTMAVIVMSIATTLYNLPGADPTVIDLLPGIDASLDQVLVEMETLLPGVLKPVADMISGSVAITDALALGQTMALLDL